MPLAKSVDGGRPVDPRSSYGLAKVICENIVLRASGINAIVARPFNHIGVGMRPDLVIPSIVRRVYAAADGAMIEMAGLDSIRDIDVGDIVKAYFTIFATGNGQHQLFNVCSGKAPNIGEMAHLIAAILNKPIGGGVFAAQGNSADDTSAVVGGSQRLQDATGWTPRYDIKQGVRRLIAG